MSQKLCPQCQVRVPLDARTCPECGHVFPADPSLQLLRPGVFEKRPRARAKIPLKWIVIPGAILAVFLSICGYLVYRQVSQIELKSVWSGGRFKNREKAKEYGLNDTEMVIVGRWQDEDGEISQFQPDKTAYTLGDEERTWTWRAEPGKYFHLPDGESEEVEMELDLSENVMKLRGDTEKFTYQRVQ